MIDSLEHEIWAIQAGYKYNYPPCCIYQFTNDIVAFFHVPVPDNQPYPASRLVAIKYNHNLNTKIKTPMSIFICCYDCSITDNNVISWSAKYGK